MIPVNQPLLDGNEKKYLLECIETGWISSEGPFVKRFEEAFAARVGRRHGIAVCNGTADSATYTVTITDSQGATSTQTITVAIKGTDSPAVVWIATTEGVSPPGGFWKDGANWETCLAPTIHDDVIVITDQLHGLTPYYPVTIDAAAFAKSLLMND